MITNNKIFGIASIIGVALPLRGCNIYGSAGFQVSRAFSGDAPIEARAGWVSGVTCLEIGIITVK